MAPQLRKDTVDKVKASKCCLKTKGKAHNAEDCKSILCQCGRAPSHNELICPNQRVQMNNLQMNCQVIECDDQTADLHMAMAQMMADDEKQVEDEMKPEEQLNLMQFSAVQGDTYGNQDNIYNFQINDFTYCLSSF